ncbi:GRB10-interacting GYF protein 2 isoform X2 [Neodiprion lecontei]|uniref:GRB10-interacting GYF protein 2 isoform X2 n=1 Tax=Neodiprion lecontei TaxID=441921 RepID=A0ABM3G2R9_NEOLC|nr:GRB10-interacting GYF protein 2 isoform X2 [Neodiprion lecontei]
MTESMRFGPEWLRNLSGDGCNTSGGGGGPSILTTPRYQLAEHRYGREEMLALFDRNYKAPEPLASFPALYIIQAQQPLALTPMTEEEAVNVRSWNSGLSNNGGRGRGGSVDRGGRGRGGRGGIYPTHYSRGAIFDEPGDGPRIEPQPFPGRTRPFDRSQSERGWSERNGGPEPGDWNGSTSPRKELGRGGGGGSFVEGNWRRQRAGEDDDGWRVASSNRGEKWVRSSWRDGGGSERGDRLERPDGVEGEEVRSGTRWEHRASHRSSHELSHHPPTRTLRTWEPNHHDNHDNLPEWSYSCRATENPSESGGSFDASGAFHGGMYSDDDEDGIISAGGNRESRIRHMSEGNNLSNSKPSSKPLPINHGQTPQTSNRRANITASSTGIRERPKSLQPFEDKESPEVQDKRSVSPSKPLPTQSNTPLKGSSPVVNSLPRKVQSATNLDKVSDKNPVMQNTRNSNKIPGDTPLAKEARTDNTINESSVVGNNDKPVLHSGLKKSKSTLGMMSVTNVRQKSEDDLDRMKEEADALVAKLMADEETHKDQRSNVPPSANNPVPGIASATQEKWFYRDPQGEVQGPFLASEMSEWLKAGYFNVNLLVRRACDERYSMLGDLIKMWGRIPFIPGPPVPPLKVTEPVAIPVPVAIPGALPKAGMEDPSVLYQYQQMCLLQNQLLFRHVRSAVINKLSQSEQWTSMSPADQNQLILQHMLQQPEMAEISPMTVNPFVPTLTAQPANPIMQLFTQMQQAKTQSENHLPPTMHPTTPTHPGTIDTVQQLMQQMRGIQNLHGIQQPSMTPTPASTPEDNPIKSLLRQLNVNGHPQATQIESVWPHPPPPQMAPPQFGNPNWQSQMGPIPAMPPGQLPNSLWDLHTKEMKTEQQILEEQKLKIQEEKKKAQLKKQEELKRQADEESAKRKQDEEAEKARLAEEAAKRTEEERKKKEEEKKRKEEEKRKQEEELKKKEEKKRKEEERKREEKRKQDEENNRKKQEEEKRKREEAKRQEEKQRKEKEKRKKLEEEQKREEEERIKKEEEARRKTEAEEQAKRAEQRRREAEALRKLQERSKAPWAQTPHAPAPSSHASLAEIQRLEREKKAEELRVQQLMQQQMAQQRTAEVAQDAAMAEISKGLQLKWAEKAAPVSKPVVKSLAQIQQEEQERLAKQQERERQEKAAQKEPVVPLQSAGIWGTAAQSLNWNSATNANNQAWSNSTNTTTGGFWDDPISAKINPTPKHSAKQLATIKAPVNTVQQPQQPQQQQQQQQNNKPTKSKNKKEGELVKKIFEQNTAKPDDFTQWCNKALGGLQASVDIPTFVGFLRDIESAYEVKEYVRLYLGDNKQCSEFAKQFLEKRSKWRSAQRPHPQADDLCKPAPAVNPNATATEFQEVKGKAKKPKKGKMYKVDSTILGFSVTAAPDRINVGDRDYGEGV